ncbi:eukaryotic translation initiation factor-like protein 3 subunit B [Pseudovirgaria hyperparasitica]|uniref:Eukaryotic translation initiation factor 3 subunit B n=1 Tax=Pseudovirgaria hyperparasitica TaxID=470096 RepID=A0A6A6WA24_9PEZI|nr:eukaryotic translation initiation factor-like protein 3 subunit B [Pseudovirgaria hyperparasitica]KAF2759415.1 eukaryotic translation initiation factor-like protein 3 subunit B [Pseudovirgaria hyperparasitica]
MAPSYDNLPIDDDFDESEIDFSDLQEQYEVRLEEGLDAFVVLDGLPRVPEDSKAKLQKYVIRKLTEAAKPREDGFFMPTNDEGMTEGFAFVEFGSPAEAAAAVKKCHGVPLDKRHNMAVNKLTDIERYGGGGRIEDEYTPPTIQPFEQKEHLRSWLGDVDGRDQMVMYRGDKVGVFWNEKEDAPENVVDREHWTDFFVQWSPLGTYLTSLHGQGVQLWGGKSWHRQKRFAHPGVNLVDYSPNEKYLVTWSHRPLQVDENHPVPTLSLEEDGKNYIIWDIATGKPLRSFVTLDVPSSQMDDAGQPIKKKMQWPTFKWSSDDKYVARMTQGQSISVYETPRMNLLEKTSIKIEGVMDFEWAPALPRRDGVKTYEQLFCYWTPELGSNPAKVGLMSVPSKEVVRTRNLFNVSDAKLHWQSEAAYVCVKVDRHSKSKKSLATNLEIFRVREKGVPVEVVEAIKETVINFAWEPKGNRFVLITTGEIPAAGVAVPPKTSVSFFAPERTKSGIPGNFHHVRTVDKKNSNAIFWSPKGRFVVVATLQSQQSFDLDFWDLSFEKSKEEKDKDSDKDLMCSLQLMNTGDHYGVTDVEWDPTGRYVATVASAFRHGMENGYHIYDFKGTLLREEPVERFKQFLWRPRPATLLSKEEQSEIRRNLRNYSRIFDEQDLAKKNTANRAVVEARRRQLEEWLAWRERAIEEVREDEEDMGIDHSEEEKKEQEEERKGEEIEEVVEEIIDETEEVA